MTAGDLHWMSGGEPTKARKPESGRAVVSDDNQVIRLSFYSGEEREPLATVELAPMSAVRLAHELIAAALRHAARTQA